MTFPAKSPPQILAEYFEVVEERAPLTLSKVKGALKGLELGQQAASIPSRLQIEWILRAHVGALEKLPLLIPRNRPPSSLELLSATRNIFENIIWLRLFEKSNEWGSKFYAKFLKENIEDMNGLIKKIEEEIRLFEQAEREDAEITNMMIKDIKNSSEEDDSSVKSIMSKSEERREELDRKVRRSFSLYSAASKYNGYGFQTHLLKTKELPRCRERLSKIEVQFDEFSKWVGDEALLKQYSERFNWRREAETVGMLEQYEYLYRLSSRLLHSGPMNILTEKELSESEQMILLEYIFVAADDAIDLIERYDFPGRLNMLLFEVNQ